MKLISSLFFVVFFSSLSARVTTQRIKFLFFVSKEFSEDSTIRLQSSTTEVNKKLSTFKFKFMETLILLYD